MATVTRIFKSVQYSGTNPQEICDIANLLQSFGQTYTILSHDSSQVVVIRDDGFYFTVNTGQWLVGDNAGAGPYDNGDYASTYAEL